MATETTNDAVIDTGGVPASEQANLSVTTTSTGTTITNTGDISGLSAVINGNVEATGGTYESATFTFGASNTGDDPTLTITDAKISGTSIIGGATPDAFNLGGSSSSAKSSATTKSKDTMAKFGEGDDSVSFLKKSLDRESTYKMGADADSITFGKGSTTKKVRVELGGNDKAGDVVDINKKADVQKLKITQFGKEDTLKIGGKTFDYDQLQDRDGKISKNITIKFD
jgi:hypothetical protein